MSSVPRRLLGKAGPGPSQPGAGGALKLALKPKHKTMHHEIAAE